MLQQALCLVVMQHGGNEHIAVQMDATKEDALIVILGGYNSHLLN
jgi:hypothetical protein